MAEQLVQELRDSIQISRDFTDAAVEQNDKVSNLLDRLAKKIELLETECSICLHKVDEPVRTPCNHVFCSTCIQRHLRTGRHTCPLCIRPLTATGLRPAEIQPDGEKEEKREAAHIAMETEQEAVRTAMEAEREAARIAFEAQTVRESALRESLDARHPATLAGMMNAEQALQYWRIQTAELQDFRATRVQLPVGSRAPAIPGPNNAQPTIMQDQRSGLTSFDRTSLPSHPNQNNFILPQYMTGQATIWSPPPRHGTGCRPPGFLGTQARQEVSNSTAQNNTFRPAPRTCGHSEVPAHLRPRRYATMFADDESEEDAASL